MIPDATGTVYSSCSSGLALENPSAISEPRNIMIALNPLIVNAIPSPVGAPC